MMYQHLDGALDNVRAQNRSSLLQLELDMTKAQVLRVMGNEEVRISRGIDGGKRVIPNPFKSEMFRTDSAGTIEVLYYYTDLQKQDGAITDDELTPIIFEKGRVAGWGRSFFDQTLNKYEIRIR